MINMADYFFQMSDFKNSQILSGIEKFDKEVYFSLGNVHFEQQKKKMAKSLEDYVFPQNADDVDLSKVTKDWFPIEKCQIFLSHSRADEKLVAAFAYYLKENFKINCFVDSCVWGYMETLLKKLDKEYCRKEQSNTYDYEKRNGTTAHVHMMLNTALMQMMHNTPVFLFVSTGNSLDDNRSGVKNWTYSSWIYSELSMSHVLCKQKKENGWRILAESAQLPMGYSNVITDHLKRISLADIQLNKNAVGSVNFEYLFNRKSTDYSK